MTNIAGNHCFRPTYRNSKTSPYLDSHVKPEMMLALSQGHYFKGRTGAAAKRTNKASKVAGV